MTFFASVSSRVSSFGAICAAFALFGAVSVAAETLTLHHPFTLAANGAWQSVSVSLAPGKWRVGTIDGPAASDAAIRSVLRNLTSIVIGARCTSIVEHQASYPCGFALSNPNFGSVVMQRFDAPLSGWTASTGTLSWVKADHGRAGSMIAFDEPSSALGSIPKFVGLVAPQQFLGDRTRVMDKTFTFAFRTESNAAVPSTFDLKSGVVTLSNEPSILTRDMPVDQRRDPAFRPIAHVPRTDISKTNVLAHPVREAQKLQPVDRLMRDWIEAFNTRQWDRLVALYHPNARRYDGILVSDPSDEHGLRSHIRRLEKRASYHAWRIVRYKTSMRDGTAACDIVFEYHGHDEGGRQWSEHGNIHFNLARHEDRWMIVSHGPWLYSALGR